QEPLQPQGLGLQLLVRLVLEQESLQQQVPLRRLVLKLLLLLVRQAVRQLLVQRLLQRCQPADRQSVRLVQLGPVLRRQMESQRTGAWSWQRGLPRKAPWRCGYVVASSWFLDFC